MLKTLSLRNIRLFSSLDLKFNKNIVIFIGDNAVGKTTILESIYLLGITKSYKGINDGDIIKFDSSFAKITGKENKEYQVVFNKEQKKVFINKTEIRRISDYIGNLKVVMFSPNDLELINGSPSIRRRFLDIEISQLSSNYLESLSKYKKILKQRSELLKKISPNDDLIFLDIISKKLIDEAKKIIIYREKFIDEINKALVSINDNEKIQIIYSPSVRIDNIVEIFQNKIDFDIYNKTTNYGPHRDDFKILLNNKDVIYCSQGQIRSIVLSIKLALINYIYMVTNNYPIVLLDDVLSELDSNRQNKLFELIDKFQTFITSTDVLNIRKDILEKAQILCVNNKEIKELKLDGKSL